MVEDTDTEDNAGDNDLDEMMDDSNSVLTVEDTNDQTVKNHDNLSIRLTENFEVAEIFQNFSYILS